ncbi:hypothetical protein MINS_34230 [Mycolicibacterium insubricum]|jgi:hypothetical protein|uniref:Uncharacterized protein n=1 Tax=Mycolicibacterium insubricum TaxID=444597 RepID=A0A1X0DBI7_9MYCO|nr:hypothetical protein [Mycolicibacterium insubricum]MCV7082206.1 hypothetical protein [Mycolicibacterium insubricum]ORA69754.1 hypothetical protein BST26_12860 [Mycolicibacterium insubricum]BBZ67994.1 hypothetical protein MINS_34230 [Mycolicibacterium insubricum]
MNTITPEAFEFSLDTDSHDQPYIGLGLVLADGQGLTVAMTAQSAQYVGRALVAHSDYLAGREPREW